MYYETSDIKFIGLFLKHLILWMMPENMETDSRMRGIVICVMKVLLKS